MDLKGLDVMASSLDLNINASGHRAQTDVERVMRSMRYVAGMNAPAVWFARGPFFQVSSQYYKQNLDDIQNYSDLIYPYSTEQSRHPISPDTSTHQATSYT